MAKADTLFERKKPVSQTVNHNGATSEALGLLYAPIQEELAEVERILREELRSDHPYVDELVRYGCMLGGKRLRPALLLLTAKATGTLSENHLLLAAVMEMIHTATLIHDDVLDEADQRRHLATVNARWNNESSVLLGDYLFTHSFYLASTLNSTDACQIIGRTTNKVCEGELRQIGSRGNYELDESEYLQIIDAKTAELCACCCRLGATYSCASSEIVDRVARYGRCLGIAFQIADDLLDLQGDEVNTGKSLGTDLEKEKPTLPLIRLLELADEDERRTLINLLTSDELITRESLMPWLERYGALSYAVEKAAWYANQAREELSLLTESPSQQVLAMLPEFVVMRTS